MRLDHTSVAIDGLNGAPEIGAGNGLDKVGFQPDRGVS